MKDQESHGVEDAIRAADLDKTMLEPDLDEAEMIVGESQVVAEQVVGTGLLAEGSNPDQTKPDSKTVVLSGAAPTPIAAKPSEQRTIISAGSVPVASTPKVVVHPAEGATSYERPQNAQAGVINAPPAAAPHTPAPAPKPAQQSSANWQTVRMPEPGELVGQYELIRELGRGGMGTVFLARDTKLGRRVAIKFLQTTHHELTQRFILEARATAQAQHENIVVIYEVNEHDAAPYMVLEYLRGATLTKHVEGGNRLPPARAVELMVPVVRALVCAHELGIVHRDLKPDNIFVTDSGTIKVLDFGIAKILQGEGADAEPAGGGQGQSLADSNWDDSFVGESTELTRMGTIMGTMSYMSPEQWGIGVDIDDRTDIWALGIMLFRMLAGKHPLDPLRGKQLVITAMLERPMPKLRDAAPNVPTALCDVIDRCLMKDKEERYSGARALLRALEPFLPGRYVRELDVDESPYAGLRAFQESDSDKFFGRSGEIAAMVTRIRDRPIMAVVGSSGVGKSSFVRAGLVPALKHSGEAWEVLVVRPGRHPLAALANILSPLIGSSTTLVDDISEQHALVERLRKEPGYMGAVLRNRARRENTNIMLFVDQFEELYTLIPDIVERQTFTACLGAIADDATSPLRVVLSVRSDFLDRVPEDQHFMAELNQGLFFLTPPNRDGLRDAIAQPAEMAGYHYETPEIIEHMLDHLETTPGALPLLQFCATKLWDGRDTTRKLMTKHSYDSIGGVVGALASHADAVLHELSTAAQSLVRQICLRLVTPERTRAIVSIRELRELSTDGKEIQRLVDHLVAARLLVVQQGTEGNAASVEIVHESLIHSWPSLRRWLDENQDDAAFLEQLRTATKQWTTKGRDPGVLWRGDAVIEADRWFKRYTGELPKSQREFLTQVFHHADKANRRKRYFFIGVITVLTIMVVGASGAAFSINESQKEATKNAKVAKKQAAAAKTSERKAKLDREKAVSAMKIANTEQAKAKQALTDRIEAEKKALAAVKREGMTQEELKESNAKLTIALKKSREAKDRYKRLKKVAEESRDRAKRLQGVAESGKKQVERLQRKTANLAKRQKERADKLQNMLDNASKGGTIIPGLK